MEEAEVKDILLALVEPNRNSPTDKIPADVRGWRFPSLNSTGGGGGAGQDDQYHQPVCFWSGVSCDPIDGTITGLNLGNGFYVETLLGAAPSSDGDDGNRRLLLPYRKEEIALRKERRPAPSTATTKRRAGEITPPTPLFTPSFPSSLGRLLSLRFIDLSSNRIQGAIPRSVLKLPNLEIFDLHKNDLEGTFPHFESDALRVLDISKNRFHGPLHKNLFGRPDIGPLTAPYLESLVKFDISENGFNGTIPLDGTSAFYDPVKKRDSSFHNLQYFDLGYNLFSGTICNNFGMLENLHGLFLEHNQLVGTIPKALWRGSGIGANPLPLAQLFLQQNSLSGTLSEELATLPNLKELFVDGNKLTGDVPTSLCNLELNNMFLNSTQAAQRCDGICCPVNSVSREGVAPCTMCPNDGGYHRYMGQHDTECRGGMSEVEILDLFFERTHGAEWLNSSYHWEKGTSACRRRGIKCNGAGQITKIMLPSLGLRGPLIPELGFLSQLRVLDVPNNELTGFVPSDLRFTPLTWLDIRGSRMRGVVPPLLCLKEGLNGNGIGPPGTDFNLLWACENIVCPMGTYSAIGRAALPDDEDEEGIQCQPCLDDRASFYIGRDRCNDVSIAGLRIRTDGIRRGAARSMPIVVALAALGALAFVRLRRRKSFLGSTTDEAGSRSSRRSAAVGDDDDDEIGPGSQILRALRPLSSSAMQDGDDESENESDDDWTAGYSEGEESMNVELARRKSRLPGVI